MTNNLVRRNPPNLKRLTRSLLNLIVSLRFSMNPSNHQCGWLLPEHHLKLCLLKCEVHARRGVPDNKNLTCILTNFHIRYSILATKNAKKVEHKRVPQPEGTYPRCPPRRQIAVGGNALTRVTKFTVNQAQRATIYSKFGRKISTRRSKPNEPYPVCLD